MDKPTINIAKKLQQLIAGECITKSSANHKIIETMITEGVLLVKLQGRSRKYIYAPNSNALTSYLSNQLGINSIEIYIANLEYGTSRAENIVAASDSKLQSRRTFKGFMVNCISPIETQLHGKTFTINPQEGAFAYIHDFEQFIIPKNTVIVGIENAENFRFIHQQKHLFPFESVLFVSRYPQSKDLISWLLHQPNSYLHYGDFDFEGIRIFRDEFYKHLGKRASFFTPNHIESLISKYGNSELYIAQYKSNASENLALNNDLRKLIALFNQYKRCLEQEVLISNLQNH